MRHLVCKILAASAVVAAVLTTVAGVASAHSNDQSYLYLDVGESITARLQLPFADLSEVLGIEIDGSDDEIDDAIEANSAAIAAYADAHFDVSVNGRILDRELLEVARFGGTEHAEASYRIDTGDATPETFEVRLDPFLEEIEGRDALLLIANDWQRGVVDNEAESLLRFVQGSGLQSVTLGEASQWTNFTTSVRTGLDHIKTGPDHMLFIFALLLPSVLVWTTAWRPAPRFGSSLWRVTKTMTMFTIAHSVTFTLAGIGIVPTPSARVTESIIALSIAATALHNLRPIFRDREWTIAFVFGLFHGFGFASLVQSLDVSTTTQLVSLLGRNVGIEIGQLFVVLAVFPALYLLRRTTAYMPLFKAAAVLLIIASIGWMGERLFDGPTFTSLVVDQLLKFPRVLIALVLITALAAWLRQREAAARKLLEPAAFEVSSDDSDFARVGG